jgi:hypothetical protein
MSNPAVERRSSKRMAVMLSATVEQASAPEDSKLLNLSSEGALVSGPELVRGAHALVRRNGVEVRGQVTWTDREQSGIRFEKRLAPESLMRSIRSTCRVKVPESRRPGLKLVPLTTADRMLAVSWVRDPWR